MRTRASNLHLGVLKDGAALVRFYGGLRGRIGQSRKAGWYGAGGSGR